MKVTILSKYKVNLEERQHFQRTSQDRIFTIMRARDVKTKKKKTKVILINAVMFATDVWSLADVK